jgi:hypothetical protein
LLVYETERLKPLSNFAASSGALAFKRSSQLFDRELLAREQQKPERNAMGGTSRLR